MKIQAATVFGGSGLLGRYIVRGLARTGAPIRVAVRHPENAGFVMTMGDVGQITPVAANIRDDASVASAVGGSDVVVNLVGVLFESGRQTFQALHVEGAERVALAARSAGARRLIHVSAIGADGTSRAAYARSKAAGEAAVRAAFAAATIVRPSVVFGPEDAFFNKFAQLARLAPALPLIGGGHTRFQPAYVVDVAAAVMAMLNDSAGIGQTYELGGPRVYQFKELLGIVLQTIGRRRLLLPVPFLVAGLQAVFLQLLPNPLLTRDQVRLLGYDNVVGGTHPGFAELGITPNALEAVLPTYLHRYRRAGARAHA